MTDCEIVFQQYAGQFTSQLCDTLPEIYKFHAHFLLQGGIVQGTISYLKHHMSNSFPIVKILYFTYLTLHVPATFPLPGTRHAHAPALPTFHISSPGHTTCSRTCSPDIPHFKPRAHDMLTHLLSRHSTFQVPGTRHAHAPALPTFHISSTGHTTCSHTCSPDIPHFNSQAHDMLTHLLSRHSTFQVLGTRYAWHIYLLSQRSTFQILRTHYTTTPDSLMKCSHANFPTYMYIIYTITSHFQSKT